MWLYVCLSLHISFSFVCFLLPRFLLFLFLFFPSRESSVVSLVLLPRLLLLPSRTFVFFESMPHHDVSTLCTFSISLLTVSRWSDDFIVIYDDSSPPPTSTPSSDDLFTVIIIISLLIFHIFIVIISLLFRIFNSLEFLKFLDENLGKGKEKKRRKNRKSMACFRSLLLFFLLFLLINTWSARYH